MASRKAKASLTLLDTESDEKIKPQPPSSNTSNAKKSQQKKLASESNGNLGERKTSKRSVDDHDSASVSTAVRKRDHDVGVDSELVYRIENIGEDQLRKLHDAFTESVSRLDTQSTL